MVRLGEFLRWPLISAAHVLPMPPKDRLNDSFLADSATYAHLRALDPGLPDHVWGVIIRYRPQLPSAQWEAVRGFTIANAVQMKPRTFETVRRLMCMSARFNAWAWTSGTTLTSDRIYTSSNVYRYLQDRYSRHSEAHRWGLVRQLGAIADTVASAPIKPLPSLRRKPSRRPFTLQEVATVHSWAGTLTTELKRQNASALLGLAGGAGLRSEEIVDVRIGDLELEGERLFVNVTGPRSRRVPVTHPWNRTLLRSVRGRTDPNDVVFRGFRLNEYPPRAIQTFLTDHPGRTRATVSSLRCTWVVAHLNNHVPTAALITIAGFTSAASLDKYLPHAHRPDMDEYAGLIIGDEVRR